MIARSRLARLALVCLQGALLAACATPREHYVHRAPVEDSTLTSQVRSALGDDPAIRAHQIEVRTQAGTVQLNGFVDTRASASRAGDLARGVSGVRRVDNNLVVRNTNATVGQDIDDSLVTVRVKAALVGDPDTKARQIGVETLHGVVQLSGFVATDTERDRAGVVATAVSGVREVHNDLALTPGR
jgi:hyperosmotically inducible protein